MHAMNAYEKVDLRLYSFLTFTLGGGALSVPLTGRFTGRETATIPNDKEGG
jgi:hypothetical protein